MLFRKIAVLKPGDSPHNVLNAASLLIENAVGAISCPVRFIRVQVNGEIVQIPIAMTQLLRVAGLSTDCPNIIATGCRSLMTGQIQLVGPVESQLSTLPKLDLDLLQHQANTLIPSIVSRGGGVQSVGLRSLGAGVSVFEFLIDVMDAMGANKINFLAEKLAPFVRERLPAGWRPLVRILSNDGSDRLVTVTLPVGDPDIPLAPLPSRIEQAVHQIMVALANDWRGSDVAISAYFSQHPDAISVTPHPDVGTMLTARFPVVLGTVGDRFKHFAFAHQQLQQLCPLSGMQMAGWVGAAAVRLVTSIDWSPDRQYGTDTGTTCAISTTMLPSIRSLSVSDRRRLLSIPDGALVGGVDPGLVRGDHQFLALPVGVLPNIKLNNRLWHALYAVEEPSIGAAISAAAKRADAKADVTSRDNDTHFRLVVTVEMTQDVAVFLDAFRFAVLDNRRAITNNKGFFNGSDAVLMASGLAPNPIGQAIRQSAFRNGRTYPVVMWESLTNGVLGTLDVVIPDNSVSCFDDHLARSVWSISGYTSCNDVILLSLVAGMLANWSATNALATKGINAGHMPLHRRATATNGSEVPVIAER